VDGAPVGAVYTGCAILLYIYQTYFQLPYIFTLHLLDYIRRVYVKITGKYLFLPFSRLDLKDSIPFPPHVFQKKSFTRPPTIVKFSDLIRQCQIIILFFNFHFLAAKY